MAVVYWEGKTALQEITYDTGSHEPVAGEVLYVDGEEATEYATIQSWTNAGGWAGAGTGSLWVYACTSAFIDNLVNGDDLEDSTPNMVCNCTAAVAAKEGDWQCAGNWGTGAAPAVPLADDEVVFDGRSTYKPTEGMLDGESGAVAQCTFDLLHFKSGWTGGVGGAAEPLICAPDRLIIDGTGTYYICCGKDDQSTDATIPMTFINNSGATVYLYSNCNDAANVCQWSNVRITAGTLYLAYYSVDTDDCGCWVDLLHVMPTGNQFSKATVHIEKDAYDHTGGLDETDIYMSNGTVYCDSVLKYVYIFDGTFYYGTDLGASPETDLNITLLVLNKGTFYWQPDDSGDDAYIGRAHIYGGLFNASGPTNNNRARVLGDGVNEIYLYPGATMNLANGKGNITLAGGSTFYNLGGTLTLDSNAAISLTYDT